MLVFPSSPPFYRCFSSLLPSCCSCRLGGCLSRVLDEDFYKQPFSELIGYVTHINHPCYRLDQAAEEAMISDLDENNPGTEWERVARLCDFNPKSSKQAKDVSRLRSVLISLKQSPLVR
ncbi:clathrin light chain A-like isoform X1 [Embiotoca jacksoni]|uniref:clathrin light chain A-like isoform X1 n=1 Tax=Embiotoca jacksoni TaxID=100190 RepID=UPI003703AF4C